MAMMRFIKWTNDHEKELVFSDDNYDFDGHIFYSSLTGEVAGFAL